MLKSLMYTVIAAVVILNVGAAFGFGVLFTSFMPNASNTSVVLDDNTRVYVSNDCMGDWASKHTTLRARQGTMAEASRLNYKAYTCDTRAYWKEVIGR